LYPGMRYCNVVNSNNSFRKVPHENHIRSIFNHRFKNSKTPHSIFLFPPNNSAARARCRRACRRRRGQSLVILLVAVIAGSLVGILRARWNRDSWQPPELRHAWLVMVAFLPQWFAFYLPVTRSHLPESLAAACLVSSQFGLLLFCWLNRRSVGMPLLTVGLIFNLLAISANGGLMPLSVDTAARFLPADALQKLQVGSRFSSSSKDILLPATAIVFPWFADRFVSPGWLNYRFVFSLGDILVSLGVFWLLISRPVSIKVSSERNKSHANRPVE